MMENIKPRQWVFVVFCIVFVIGSLIYSLATKNPDRLDWKKSVGRVVFKSTVRSKWRRIEHYIDGERYEGQTGSGLEGNCYGDVYEILVDPIDFTEITVLNEHPLFLKGEAVGETIGWLTEDYKTKIGKEYEGAYPKFMNYDNGYNEISVEFFYIVDGKKYSRVQLFRTPLDSPLVFQKEMRFRVRYWLKNPQRAILDYEERR